LKGPPNDFKKYIRSPDDSTPEKNEQNLRGLIKQGLPYIMPMKFETSTIKNLEPELIENKCMVQFFASGDSDTTFFLMKV
jgi:hypothetical protein